MNCKSLKPKDHYFWFHLQSEENDRSVHFLVRVMLKLEKDAMGLSKVTASTDPDFIPIFIQNIISFHFHTFKFPITIPTNCLTIIKI